MTQSKKKDLTSQLSPNGHSVINPARDFCLKEANAINCVSPKLESGD